jgi:hypothetical protein
MSGTGGPAMPPPGSSGTVPGGTIGS